jgi:hypothetical protein
VRGEINFGVVLLGVLGLALLAVGVIYLAVACQSLPGFLGPVHGDTAPRTGRGIAAVALGAIAVILFGYAVIRRRSRP